jgi:hypothetical protein
VLNNASGGQGVLLKNHPLDPHKTFYHEYLDHREHREKMKEMIDV